jgi:5-hydroxydodecatetraenal polyketide synthase CpkA
MELRNRLRDATEVDIPATVVFDHPTPAALVAYLKGELALGAQDPADAALAELDRLETLLSTLDGSGAARDRISIRLRTLMSRWNDDDGAEESGGGPALDGATDDDLFNLVENLGNS